MGGVGVRMRRRMALKYYGINSTIKIFVLYCIVMKFISVCFNVATTMLPKQQQQQLFPQQQQK